MFNVDLGDPRRRALLETSLSYNGIVHLPPPTPSIPQAQDALILGLRHSKTIRSVILENLN